MKAIINRVNKIMSEYQTRQQLLNLPKHLLKDIALTDEQRLIEVKKMAFFARLNRLIKGD